MKQAIEERLAFSPGFCERPDIHRGTTAKAPAPDVSIPEGQRQRFTQHALVYLEGDQADRIHQVVDGAIMLYKLLPDGRRQVVELLGPGDVFGFSSQPIYESSAETLTPVVTVVYERSAVERSSAFLVKLHRTVQAQICALHEHAVLLGRKSALERVASFLMRFVPQRGGYGCIGRVGAARDDRAVVRLSMTRQEIADYLGLTIETVSRAFSELKRRGIVTLDKQDEVKINDVCGICRLTGAH